MPVQTRIQRAGHGGDDLSKVLALFADADLRAVVRYWIGGLGFTVDVAQDGAHAAKLLRASEYRALLTDRLIPPWPGLEGMPGLKRRYPHVQIVVLLERGPLHAAALLRSAGVLAIVEPPFRRAALAAAISPNGGQHQLSPLDSRSLAIPGMAAICAGGEPRKPGGKQRAS